jgi:signal transduction histidine kinase/FixJ family two-component response regulator
MAGDRRLGALKETCSMSDGSNGGAERAAELRVLLIEDSPDDAELVTAALRRGGYEPMIERIEEADAMRAALREREWDLVIADYHLPRFSAPEAQGVLRESGLDLPFLVVSGAMKSGAHDYIMKDELTRLIPAVERELREAGERRSRRKAEEAWQQRARVSAALARVSRELIGYLDTPVLLERLCALTAELLECDSSYTLLADPKEDVFVPLAGHGATAEELEVARVVKVPRVFMSLLLERLRDDDVAEVHTIPTEALSVDTPPDMVLCTALRKGDDVIGIQVAVRRQRSTPFDETQREIARGVAQIASLALDHARVVEELERASRVKSEFVATISHELRTPLNVVMGYSDLLIEGAFGALNAEQLDALRRIGERARGLLELINATLDLSRLEAGRISVDFRPVDVRQLLDGLRADVTDWQVKPNVELVWSIAPSLPTLSTDGAKLKVVLKNLITNAIKFTDQGSVTFGAAPAGHGIRFTIADTGVGIPADQLAIVFEPFRQGDSSSTRRYGGVGLGLYIVQRLLDLLGGTIELKSEIGRGSTFTVWVPESPSTAS